MLKARKLDGFPIRYDLLVEVRLGWVGNFKDQKGQVIDGKWHHVAVTTEGKNGTLQYYVDG